MPEASTATIERLMPIFPLSTGLLPAFCPPQRALVMQQSTATSESSSPMMWSYASRQISLSRSITPSSIHASGLRRSVLSEHAASALFS